MAMRASRSMGLEALPQHGRYLILLQVDGNKEPFPSSFIRSRVWSPWYFLFQQRSPLKRNKWLEKCNTVNYRGHLS